MSKLTGLSVATLQRWHASELQSATNETGQRGTPRLYSWVDYQRLCVMAGLKAEGVPTTRIRQSVLFLDEMIPRWWEMSLRPYRGQVPGSQARIHVVLRTRFDVVVDVEGHQTTFREMLGADAEDAAQELDNALRELSARGPLYLKSEFEDAVSMNPDLNASQPTIRDTSLETSFVQALVERMPVEQVARLYRVEEWKIRRASEFERAA